MTVLTVSAPPAMAPGKGVTEQLASGLVVVCTDSILFNDTSPVTVASLPENTLVVGAVCEVETAFAGTAPTLALGIAGDTGRHLATGDITATAVGFYEAFKAHNYTAVGTLIATIGGTGLSAGKARFWLLLRLASNTLNPIRPAM